MGLAAGEVLFAEVLVTPMGVSKGCGYVATSSSSSVTDTFPVRIVEFGNPEDAQRAVRELSEMTLLGRPVYIREVRLTPLKHTSTHHSDRTVKMNLGLELHRFQVKWAWLWLDKASTLLLLHVLPPTITLVTLIREINFTLET